MAYINRWIPRKYVEIEELDCIVLFFVINEWKGILFEQIVV